MSKIDIHADDYALSLHSSQDIIALVKEKKLDSISIMPNMRFFEEAVQMLEKEEMMEIPISVHLNFMEGKCCADPKEISLLVDENGYFKVSWGSLFLNSFQPARRRALMLQLAKEMEAQIWKVMEVMPADYQLRLDSHQHTHMIPVVRDALLLVVDRMTESVTFVRLSKEPLTPFLCHPELFREYSLPNAIKNVLLWMLSFPLEKQLRKRKTPYAYLWGLMLSGNMKEDSIRCLYADMKEYANKKGQNLEILFHPGTVLTSEISEENVKQGFINFHLSSLRRNEYEAVQAIDNIQSRGS